MSSEPSIKTISIDPELFSLPGTKKTKKKSQTPKPKSTSKGDAKRKKDRIKEFRKSFMQKLEMTQPNKSNPNSQISSLSSNSSKPESSSPDVLLSGMPNEFSNSLEYIQNRYEKHKNTTNTNIPPTEINKEPNLQTNSIIPTDSKPVPYMLQSSSVVPTPTQSVSSSDTTSDIPSDTSSNTSLILPDKPWGNLKGGNKLTYRNWKTKTQKASTNNPEHQVQVQHTANSKDNYTESSSTVPPASTSITTSNIQNPLKSSITKKEHDTPTLSSETSVSVPVKKRITKTKTSKTYKLGRSLKTRKISVLLKNKTVKNKIIVAKNRLKHISLVDIKLYLKKHNLIKSGMSTPHSLLRHMYESAIMSGEVFNNNDDMLIHNFNNPE
ncbi:hypothetical protein OAA60_01465 [Porticoccaceae bacterium]|jgi:hypothetical protein|nr:hypothetical protein [Porticoccaceae bacterium]